MAIDNDVYDRIGATWWSEDNPLNMLHGSVTPARIAYFRRVLPRLGVTGGRVLDVGCGCGFLAEEMAVDGFEVTGVDPSEVALATARRHAEGRGLAIRYEPATGEMLPFADAAFDVAMCCDVLEHVGDVDRVVGEMGRVLRPGGVLLFDTPNRTRMSKLLGIRALQEWRLTRVFDTPIHDWDMFVTPDELSAIAARHRLAVGEVVGLGPRAPTHRVIGALRALNAGRLTYGEASRRLDFGVVRTLQVSYMGYAVRVASEASETRGAQPGSR